MAAKREGVKEGESQGRRDAWRLNKQKEGQGGVTTNRRMERRKDRTGGVENHAFSFLLSPILVTNISLLPGPSCYYQEQQETDL